MQPRSPDVIIVGAGSAGAILAARLSEDPQPVGLADRGRTRLSRTWRPCPTSSSTATPPPPTSCPSDHDWGFVGRARPSPDRWPCWRGKVTGGSSAINGEIFLRGIPEDFDAWAARGQRPLAASPHVLPYYCKLERDLDMVGAVPRRNAARSRCSAGRREEWLPPQRAFEAACLAAGFPPSPDHNAPDAIRRRPAPAQHARRHPLEHQRRLSQPARARPNLTILADARSAASCSSGKRATGVVARRGGETIHLLGDEIILSAGAVGSPHLLMLSGIGPAEHLRAAGCPSWRTCPASARTCATTRTSTPPGARAPATRWTRTSRATRSPCATPCLAPRCATTCRLLMTSFATDRVDRGGDGRTPVGITIQPVLNLARSSGRLTLQSADPAVQPAIDFNLLDDPSDRSRLRDALHLCLDLARHPSFADILGERLAPGDDDLASDAALDAWMRREVTHHQPHLRHLRDGTGVGAAGGGRPERPRSRPRRDLRVVDASIMPDCVRANTNATAMMIGERIADLIADGS